MSNQNLEDTTFLVTQYLDYKSIKSLALVNKESKTIILKELRYYFSMIPDYIKRDREFKKHHNDMFIALQDAYPDSSLYNILAYLNTNDFKELKRKTDEYIKKEGLDKAIQKSIENHRDFIHITLFDTSGIKDMSDAFYYLEYDPEADIKKKFNQPLNLWVVSNVIDMSGLFAASEFNQPLNLWDVSSVENMNGMFQESEFNQPLNSWDVSNVRSMNSMFAASDFNQPLNKWDISNVRDMNGMFRESQFNQSLKSWDVSNVTSMRGMFTNSMFDRRLLFDNAKSFF